MKQDIDGFADHCIAQIVEGTLVLGKIGGGQTVSDHHVSAACEHFVHQLRRTIGGIGIVTVGHDVALSVDLTEHPADHVAFSLLVFIADNSACLFCNGGRAVSGIVVIDVDHCFRQGAPKI